MSKIVVGAVGVVPDKDSLDCSFFYRYNGVDEFCCRFVLKRHERFMGDKMAKGVGLKMLAVEFRENIEAFIEMLMFVDNTHRLLISTPPKPQSKEESKLRGYVSSQIKEIPLSIVHVKSRKDDEFESSRYALGALDVKG